MSSNYRFWKKSTYRISCNNKNLKMIKWGHYWGHWGQRRSIGQNLRFWGRHFLFFLLRQKRLLLTSEENWRRHLWMSPNYRFWKRGTYRISCRIGNCFCRSSVKPARFTAGKFNEVLYYVNCACLHKRLNSVVWHYLHFWAGVCCGPCNPSKWEAEFWGWLDVWRPALLCFTVNQHPHWACWQYGHSEGTQGWLGVGERVIWTAGYIH